MLKLVLLIVVHYTSVCRCCMLCFPNPEQVLQYTSSWWYPWIEFFGSLAMCRSFSSQVVSFMAGTWFVTHKVSCASTSMGVLWCLSSLVSFETLFESMDERSSSCHVYRSHTQNLAEGQLFPLRTWQRLLHTLNRACKCKNCLLQASW
jgi:hypothetical protein